MKNNDMEKVKMAISIVERGQSKYMINIFNEQSIYQNFICLAHGTATSEIMDLLGLDSLEKEIIFSLGRESKISKLLYDIKNDMVGSTDLKGIIFDLPIEGMSQLVAMAMMSLTKPAMGEEVRKLEDENDFSMIIVTVNQGFTEEVMETARKAGARGGTVIHSR